MFLDEKTRPFFLQCEKANNELPFEFNTELVSNAQDILKSTKIEVKRDTESENTDSFANVPDAANTKLGKLSPSHISILFDSLDTNCTHLTVEAPESDLRY